MKCNRNISLERIQIDQMSNTLKGAHTVYFITLVSFYSVNQKTMALKVDFHYKNKQSLSCC